MCVCITLFVSYIFLLGGARGRHTFIILFITPKNQITYIGHITILFLSTCPTCSMNYEKRCTSARSAEISCFGSLFKKASYYIYVVIGNELSESITTFSAPIDNIMHFLYMILVQCSCNFLRYWNILLYKYLIQYKKKIQQKMRCFSFEKAD